MRAEEDLHVETGYRVLYEDGFFLAADKPSPLPVHPVGSYKEKNLLSLLKRDLHPGGKELRIVNRLDSETSGIVLVAKSGEMAGRLGRLFELRQVTKEYHAVTGRRPQGDVRRVIAVANVSLRTSSGIRYIRTSSGIRYTTKLGRELINHTTSGKQHRETWLRSMRPDTI